MSTFIIIYKSLYIFLKSKCKKCKNDITIISSHKILWRTTVSVRLVVARGEKLFEVKSLEARLELQDGCSVATAIHVVRGGEQSQGLLGVLPVEPGIHHLVSSDEKVQPVVFIPLLSHVLTKGVSRPPGTGQPATVFLIRVAPGDVRENSRVAELRDPLLLSDAVQAWS